MDFGNELGDQLILDGILSLNDFSDYLVTFNYPNETVEFYIGFLDENDKNVKSYSGSIIGVEIEINGEKKNAFLDTGFPGSFGFPFSMKDELRFKSSPVQSGSAGMVGATFKIWKAQLDGEMHLANIAFDSPEIILEERKGDFITIGYQALKVLSITLLLINKTTLFYLRKY